MKAKFLSLTLLAAGIIGGLSTNPVEARTAVAQTQSATRIADPARQIEDLARLFRASDVVGLSQAVVPASKWEEVTLLYELKQLEKVDDEDRAEFAEKLARFTGPDAVDELMEGFEPELEKARPQAPGALMMGFGAMHMAITSPDSKLTDEQRVALQAAFPAIQQWASTTDFLSSDTLRRALTLLTDAARSTGISDLDQLKAMPLEAVLDRARPILVAAKQAVKLYGIDLDQVADSLNVEVLAIEGETARVRTTITLFDAPVWHEHDLVLVEGRWYPKHAAVRFAEDENDVEVDVDVETKAQAKG
ncbi:MAG: hypothetical protein ACT4NL_06220 [Pseudomarimonas sp.]